MQKQPRPDYSGKTYGDLGDILNIIPIARALGSMSLYAQNNPLCKPILTPERFNAIKSLMDVSPYIKCFEPYAGQHITHDMSTFREGGIEWGMNLAQLHAKWVGVEISEEPWLEVKPDKKYKNKIVVNRSTRHHNILMNWVPILEHYLPDVIFIGLPEEHIQLQNETGLKFPYVKTDDLLHAAQIISASKAFLGNQSSCLNLAIAMGKKYLCEASLTSVDTVFKRDCQYVLDGEVVDFRVDGYDPLNTKSNIPEREMDFSVSAPGGFWKYICKDGYGVREINGFDTLRKVNDHERGKGLALSTRGDITQQMSVHFPTFGQNCYANWMIDQIYKIKELINKVQYQ